MRKSDGREVWFVVMRSEEYGGENREYYVFASSAAFAEKRGFQLAKQDEDFPKPYCSSSEFSHYVQ